MAHNLDKYLGDVPVVADTNENDIESIRNWMKAQPHLPTISDRQISVFLHCCYGALELTKNTIDSYYTIRTLSPELFAGRKEENLVKTLETIYVFKMPGLTVDDYHILYGGLYDMDPEKFVVLDSVRVVLSLLDVYSNLEPNAAGWRVVLNSKGFTFGHFVKLTTSLAIIKIVINYVQVLTHHRCQTTADGVIPENVLVFNNKNFPSELSRYLFLCYTYTKFTYTPRNGFQENDALPIRLKGIHVFNAIPLISQFVALIKPFMNKELYDLINIHPTSDTESLYNFILQENLPNNADGKGGEIEDLLKTSIDHLDKYRIWFAEEEKVAKVDESKRIGKSKIQNDSFGVEGSFKKLSVD